MIESAKTGAPGASPGATLLADVRLWAFLCLGFIVAGLLPSLLKIDLDMRIEGADGPASVAPFESPLGELTPLALWAGVVPVGLICLVTLVPFLCRGLRRGAEPPIRLLGRDLFTVALGWLLVQLLFQIVLAATSWRGEVDAVLLFEMLAVADLVVVAMVAWVLWRRFGRVDLRVFERAGDAGRNLGFAALGYALFVPVLLAGAAVLDHVASRFDLAPPTQEVAGIVRAAVSQGGLAIVVVGIAIVLVIPLTEELLFRGLVQTTFRKWMGRWPAIALSAIAFTLVHVESDGLGLMHLLILALGIFLGAVFDRSGQLRISILVHALHNLGQLVLTLVAPS
jgi:membrane protease YdiL (CAAX protease family)